MPVPTCIERTPVRMEVEVEVEVGSVVWNALVVIRSNKDCLPHLACPSMRSGKVGKHSMTVDPPLLAFRACPHFHKRDLELKRGFGFGSI